MGMSNRELVERYLRCYNDKNVHGKKAGQEIRLRGASFFTIRNGRITRLVDYM